MQMEARAVILQLNSLERQLLDKLGKNKITVGSSISTNSENVHVVGLARLLLGACCEAFLALKTKTLCTPGTRTSDSVLNVRLARLYKDSLHAAAWTSAHAHYVDDIINCQMSVCLPSLHSVKSELNEPDLSNLYAHRMCSSNTTISKDAACMLSLLTRCTNPGRRG